MAVVHLREELPEETYVVLHFTSTFSVFIIFIMLSYFNAQAPGSVLQQPTRFQQTFVLR